MVSIATAVLFFIIFAVSIVFSMLGQGGGTLYTPIQVWSGINFHTAATTSLFLIMITSFSATLVFRKAKRVDWPLALVLESVTILGGFCGGIYSGWFSGTTLSFVFAGVVAFAAFFMIHNFKLESRPRESKTKFLFWKRQLGDKSYSINLPLALSVSFAAGIISGLIGVGGGILKVPFMVLLLGIPIEIAIGSSAFMVGFTAAGGFLGHVISGHWDWRMSIVLAVAVFIGGQIGARKSLHIDKQKLRKGFGWFLLLIAIIMCIKAL